MRYLQYGGLPAVYLSEHPEEELNAYVHTYLTPIFTGLLNPTIYP